jgi:hypothetical protein
VNVDGVKGVELTSTANDEQTDIPMELYQVIVVRGDTYYIVQGLVGKEAAAKYLPEFRKVVDGLFSSIKRKRSGTVPEQPKIWFKAYGPRLWVPVTVEGWLITGVVFMLFVVIFAINDVGSGVKFSLKRDWPMLAEGAAVALFFQWYCRDHVE